MLKAMINLQKQIQDCHENLERASALSLLLIIKLHFIVAIGMSLNHNCQLADLCVMWSLSVTFDIFLISSFLSDYFNKAPLRTVLIFRKISTWISSFVSLSCSRCITFNSFTLAQKAKNDSQISENMQSPGTGQICNILFIWHKKDSLDGEKIFRWFVLRRKSVKFTYLQLEKNKFVTKQTRKGIIRSDHYKKIRNFCQPGFHFKR